MKKSLIQLLTILVLLPSFVSANIGPQILLTDKLELILIFVAVIVGVVSASYFYLSTNIFINLLKRPLKYIATGMLIISIGVLLAAFITFESKQGIQFILYGVPLSAYFYILYIIGSMLILFGARRFSYKPPKPYL